MEQAWPGIRADLGLEAPEQGSLDWLFILALVGGATLAWIVGGITQARDTVSWLMLASLVVWQPVVEELLFRGVLQGMLRRTGIGLRSCRGLSVANLVASLAFVLVHLVNQPTAWAVAVLAPSLVFGYFRDRSGSVLPPLALHIVYNGAFFVPLTGAL